VTAFGPSAAHDVERLELPCEVVRFVEGGRTGGDEADPLGAARDSGERHHDVALSALSPENWAARFWKAGYG
jgi:hypothetical protein